MCKSGCDFFFCHTRTDVFYNFFKCSGCDITGNGKVLDLFRRLDRGEAFDYVQRRNHLSTEFSLHRVPFFKCQMILFKSDCFNSIFVCAICNSFPHAVAKIDSPVYKFVIRTFIRCLLCVSCISDKILIRLCDKKE